MGRIMIPIRLREELGFEIGNEYSFFTHETDDGQTFLCIKCPSGTDDKIKKAIDFLKSKGIETLCAK